MQDWTVIRSYTAFCQRTQFDPFYRHLRLQQGSFTFFEISSRCYYQTSTTTTMPPRLSLNRLCHSCQSLLISPSVFLPRRPTPWLALLSHHQTSQQSRYASILASISDTPGAYSKKIRRGRGPSSGKGKTSGRGHKGQKQHGKVPAHFNGGQTPLEVVKGKRGFKNVFALDMAVVNLDRIQAWIDVGRLDPCRVITVRELCQSRCLHRVKDGVKVLARVCGWH